MQKRLTDGDAVWDVDSNGTKELEIQIPRRGIAITSLGVSTRLLYVGSG